MKNDSSRSETESADPRTEEREETAPEKRKLSWRRRLVYKCLTVMLGLLVSLLILEIVLRLSSWEIRSLHHIGGLYRYHPTLGRELIPSWEATVPAAGRATRYTINEQGFRDPDVVGAKRPGVPRIALLGDSLTWGWGVSNDDVVSECLEDLTTAEVVNMGMNAAGTGVEWLLLKEKGLALEPDVVVLNFFVGNDYRNNLSRDDDEPHFLVSDAGGITVANVPVPRSLGDRASAFAKRNLLSYFFIGYYTGRLRIEIKYSERWYGDVYRAVTGRSGSGDEVDLEIFDKYRSTPTESMRRTCTVTEKLLRELRETCRAHDVKLLVAVVPDRLQVESDSWNAAFGRTGLDPTLYDVTAPTRACLEMCRRLDIASVDLFPAMREAHEAGTPVYIRRDIHWNPAGHRTAARVIHEELLERGWVGR